MENKISVVITSYNRYEYLTQAIHSAVMQDYSNKEIIVVDDCSDDLNYDEFKMRDDIIYIRNEANSGASMSRKNGYRVATGEYIIFMDDDDYYTNPDFLKKAMNGFLNNTDISFVSGNVNVYDQQSEQVLPANKLPFYGNVDREEYLKGFQTKYIKPYSTFSTVFSMKVIDKIIEMPMFNDSSIYLGALLYGKPYFLEDIIGNYRVHKSNMTKALNVEFILQNLKQKKDIKDAMLSQVSFDLEKWFYQQVKLTVDYYLRETRPQLKSAVAVLKWGLQNMKKNRLHFFLDWLYDLVYSYRATRKCGEENKYEA